MASKPFVIFPATATQKLNFDAVLDMLRASCIGSLGLKQLEEQGFYTDRTRLQFELQAVSELKQVLSQANNLPYTGFNELPFLNKLGIENYAIDETEGVQLYAALQALSAIRQFFQKSERTGLYPVLSNWISGIPFDAGLPARIGQVIDMDRKEVKESASPELGSIRRAMQQVQQSIQAAFRRSLTQYKNLGFLAETEETVRDGRRVLSVMSEHKRSVKGMIVDESHNGNITYIEPETTVALNNDWVSLQLEERREIRKILLELTAFLRPHRDSFIAQQSALGQWDAWQAKAQFAVRFNAIQPVLSAEPRLFLKNFRHPVLEHHLTKTKKPIVPNSLQLDDKHRILVISGPNAGGKSIILKSVGILQLMLQFGMLVPADEGSEMSVFEKLFIDIDDDQSIENDVSTYSSHLQKMRHFVLQADKRTLVLLDEMGVGTDPALGGAMAEAVLQVLNEKQVMGVVTTHFHNLKVYAAQTPGLQSAAMAFDKQELQPRYQLLPGQPGSSFTFEIAQKSGMPQQVIQLAREKSGENKKALDDTLAEMQVEKQFIRGIRKNVQKQEEQLGDLVQNYQQLKKELDRDKKKLRRQYEQQLLDMFNEQSRELERMMREWKEERSDKMKFDQVKKFVDDKGEDLEHKMETPVLASAPDAVSLVVGSRVRMENGQETGIIREIKKDMAAVAFGQLTTRVKLHNLVPVTEQEQAKGSYVYTRPSSKLTEKSAFELELDIRGLLKEEAFIALENFLDRAVMYGSGKVRIIHGRGTGALRQAVHTYLKKYPYVKKFYADQEMAGGSGITIVEMK